TNDLDVTTLGVLEDALLEHPGCVFIVSHDRRFLDRVATGILAFERAPGADPTAPCTVTPVLGDWTNYQRTQKERLAALALAAAAPAATSASSSPTTTSASAPAAPAKAVRKRTNKEEREWSGM